MPKNNSIFNCLKGLCKVGSTGGGDVSSKVYKKETVLKLYKSARRLVDILKTSQTISVIQRLLYDFYVMFKTRIAVFYQV